MTGPGDRVGHGRPGDGHDDGRQVAGQGSEHGSQQGGSQRRYRLDGRIATGGMGEVWRATDLVLGRQVALKLLKAEYADDASFRSRFETEARNAAALHHAHVASVFDFGELPGEDGEAPRPYLVMELVRGRPLSDLLRSGEPMPADTAAHLLAQAADGLAAAHALGIVHRDVKPANLLITPDGTVKITDFGIARAADAAALTITGQVLGTPQYLSPEQAEGKSATAASDVYSLGVVLYECLAGRRPFTGDSAIAVALAHLREQPPPLGADVPPRLRRIVETALAKDPAARFGSVSDFAAALRGADVPVAGGAAAGSAAGSAAGAEAPTAVHGSVTAAAAAGGLAAALPVTDRDADGTQVVTTGPVRDRGPGGRPTWLPWVVTAATVLAAVLLVAWLAGRTGGADPSDPATTAPATSPTASASSSQAASRTPSPSPTPTPTPTPTQPSASATPSATATPASVQVVAGDYLGRDADAAAADLESLGLTVRRSTVDNPGDQDAGTVAEVSPTGTLEAGETVTLSVYGEAATTPTPDPDVTETPGQNGNGNGNGSGNANGRGSGTAG